MIGTTLSRTGTTVGALGVSGMLLLLVTQCGPGEPASDRSSRAGPTVAAAVDPMPATAGPRLEAPTTTTTTATTTTTTTTTRPTTTTTSSTSTTSTTPGASTTSTISTTSTVSASPTSVAVGAATQPPATPASTTAATPQPTPTLPPTPATEPTATPATAADPLAAEVVAITNAERAAAGLPALTTHGALEQAALSHSADQAAMQLMSHTGSDGADGGTRITRTGFTGSVWGENVAAGYADAASVVAGWMASPGHRANIIRPDFTFVGIASAVADDGTRYWTMMLAA